MFKKVFATGAMLAMAVSVAHAQGNVPIYSNVTTGTGGYTGGAAGYTAAGTYGYLVADDINVLAGFGGKAVNAFSFSIVNYNTTAVAIQPTVSFYTTDGTNGGPGTILAAYSYNLTKSASSYTTYTSTIPGAFTVPTNGSFWAAISFTSATATAAQMANIGQYLFNPPTAGTSQDVFFQSTATTQGLSSNPAGGFYAFDGSGTGPVANFGWAFQAAPEPSQYAAFGLGILGLGALALKARRRSIVA